MPDNPPEPHGDTIAGDPRLMDVVSSFAAPDPDDARSPAGPTLRERVRNWFGRSGDDVVGGVSVEIGTALGVDTLWVRLTFVVLALVGGLGVFLYAGLWLALIVGADRRWARITGGVVVVGLIPWFISAGRPTLATGTGAVLVLLVGLTLALWNRTAEDVGATSPSIRRTAVGPDRDRDHDHDADATVEHPVVEAIRTDEPRRRRQHREQHRERRTRPPASPVGRTALGVAIVVAAVGALIDQTNGGRLHPEQWLGAAAVICGLGLLVTTVRGRGRWLILPAAGFAVAGFVWGAFSQAGVPIQQLSGQSYTYVDEFVGQDSFEPRSGFGESYVDIAGAPGTGVVEIDARAVFGDVRLSVADDVRVLVRTDIDDGSVTVNGRSEGPTFAIGPDGVPEVIVDARAVHGDVNVETYDRVARDAEIAPPPFDPTQSEYPIGELVTLRGDGFVFVDEGAVIIGPDNIPVSGAYFDNGDRYALQTGFGSWELIGNLLISPTNELIDLDQARAAIGVGASDPGGADFETGEIPPQATTVPPSTVPPSTVPSSTALPTAAPNEVVSVTTTIPAATGQEG